MPVSDSDSQILKPSILKGQNQLKQLPSAKVPNAYNYSWRLLSTNWQVTYIHFFQP